MNEPSEEVKAMAARVADRIIEQTAYRQGTDNYARVWQGAHLGALAAILETQEAVASWLEQYPSPMDDLNLALRIRGMCTAIRTGTHYGKAEQ